MLDYLLKKAVETIGILLQDKVEGPNPFTLSFSLFSL